MSKKHWKARLAALLALVLIFSVLYLALEADHDCHGEDCAICAQIHACTEILGQLALTLAVILLALALQGILTAALKSCTCSHRQGSLITLKVKLSN